MFMLKHYLRALIIAALSFYVAYTLIPTINIGNDIQNIYLIIGGLLAVSLIVKPIFSLILLPINILTFGALSLILNTALIFAFTKFLPGFSVSPYNFPGINFQYFIIQPASLSWFATIAAIGAVITIIQKLLHIIFE